MRYQLLDVDGQPIDGAIIVADAAFMESAYAEGSYQLAEDQGSAPAAARHITKLAFRQRFTAAERVALEIASLDDPGAAMSARQQAAALRSNQADVQAATYIDLARPDTRAGVIALEAGGLLAPGRALQILDAEIQDHEIYRG